MTFLAASLFTLLAIQPATHGGAAYQLNREGRILLGQHRYPAAVRAFQRAVDTAEFELGPRDPATAMILRNLALAYVQTNNFEEAERTAKLAYSLIESRFGPADPALTPILNVLAEAYASSGHIDEALAASEQAVSIGPFAGAHYGTALHNLGALREYSGDFEAAASCYRRAIVMKTETLGQAHPFTSLSKTALRRVQNREYNALRIKGPIRLEQADE